MRTAIFLFLLATLTIISCQKPSNEYSTKSNAANTQEYYQLKVYSFQSDKQVAITDQYLQKAFLPGLKRQGIKSIGVFKPKEMGSDTLQKTYVLIPFNSIEQFLSIEDRLSKDSEYLAAGAEYLNASYEKPPYLRIESNLLKAFPDMPRMQPAPQEGPRSERVYELRSYESATEQLFKSKVDMFNAGGEIKLFDRLGFNAVFYSEVISGAKMPNLIYMTTFSDRPTRDSLWNEFVISPEWQEMITISKYENTVSHADIWLLYPTDYSDY